MTRPIYSLALFAMVLLLLGPGCARDKRDANLSEPYALPSTWIRAAETHELEGDLQRALYEYRIARTVSDRDTVINREIKRLQNRIDEKTRALSVAAKKAERQGKTGRARRLYLETLSLNPKHRGALMALRELDERSSKKSMRNKTALSRRYQKGKAQKKGRSEYQDEGYAYSRQAILQAESRAADVPTYIKELEQHIIKYPKDSELGSMLLNTRIVQARAVFRAEQYDESLHHLLQAEKVFRDDKKALDKISGMRKEFARELYLKGVRSARSSPGNAVKLWRNALKFDPEDKRTLLRIHNTGL